MYRAAPSLLPPQPFWRGSPVYRAYKDSARAIYRRGCPQGSNNRASPKKEVADMRFWFAPNLIHYHIKSEVAYLYVQQRVAEVGLPALETILEALKSDDADVRDLVC